MDSAPNFGSLFLFDGLTDAADVTVIDLPDLEYKGVKWYIRPDRKYEIVSIEEAKSTDFDLIVIANQHQATLDYMRELQKRDTPNVIYFNSDTPGIDRNLMSEFQANKCFLREFYYNEKYPDYCIALPFAYPPTMFSSPFKHREIDLLFAMSANNNPARMTWYHILQDKLGHINAFFNLDNDIQIGDYFSLLDNSKIVIDIRGFGADTVRFYEAIAHGAFLITNETMLCRPNPFINHHHVCYTEESRIIHWVNHYLQLEADRTSMAHNSQQHLLQYHTTDSMAERFLSNLEGIS